MGSAAVATERKRAVQLTLSESVVLEAEAAGVNISSTVEEALRTRTRLVRGDCWREENKEAVAWHNALTDRLGGSLHEVLAEDATLDDGNAV